MSPFWWYGKQMQSRPPISNLLTPDPKQQGRRGILFQMHRHGTSRLLLVRGIDWKCNSKITTYMNGMHRHLGPGESCTKRSRRWQTVSATSPCVINGRIFSGKCDGRGIWKEKAYSYALQWRAQRGSKERARGHGLAWELSRRNKRRPRLTRLSHRRISRPSLPVQSHT